MKGRADLAAAKLPATQKYLLDRLLAQLHLLSRQIEDVQGQLARMGGEDGSVQRRMRAPGIDDYSAQITLEVIGDMGRFPSAKQLSP